MGLFDHFPYTNFHELNLDWILNALRELEHTIDQFVAINALKYADPIQWNIVSQYEKNTIVIDPLTGTAYISVQPVPSGVALTNTDYWTVVFDLGSFVVRAARNFTDKWEDVTTLTATFASNVNDWIIWGDVLYRVLSPIVAGDQYVVGSNIAHFTAEDVIGHIQSLSTSDKSNLVAAVNEIVTNIGNLSALTTTDKSNLVAAINEVLQLLIDTAGDLSSLNTQDKTDLVSAINETLANKTYSFETVADMIADDTITEGSICLTSGYYSSGDGGGAKYSIVSSSASPFTETLDNGLIAVLEYTDSINILTLGATHDADCSGIIQSIIDETINVIIPDGTFICDHSILLDGYKAVSITGCPHNMYSQTPQLDFSNNTEDTCIHIMTGFAAIKNIDIKGCYDADPLLTQCGIKLEDASYIVIENVTTWYCYYGMYLTHTWGTVIRNVNCRYSEYGVFMTSINNGDTTARVVNTSLDHVYAFNSKTGFYIHGDDRVYLSNCNTDTCHTAFNILYAWVSLFNIVCELYDEQGLRVSNGATVIVDMGYWLPDTTVLYYDITIDNSYVYFYNSRFIYLNKDPNIVGTKPYVRDCFDTSRFKTRQQSGMRIIYNTPAWTDNVTLDESAADFTSIDVYWRTSTGSSGVVTLRDGDTSNINNMYSNASNTYFYTVPVSVSGTALTLGSGYSRAIYGTAPDPVAAYTPGTDYMITKVVGYYN